MKKLWKRMLSTLSAGVLAAGLLPAAIPEAETALAADAGYPVQTVNLAAYTTNRNLSADGGTVDTQERSGEQSQQWEFEWVSDGVFRILNEAEGSYLTASGSKCSTASGSGGKEQQWNISGVQKDAEGMYLYYKITNAATGGALTYYQGGNSIGLTDYTADGAQKWKLNLYGLQGYAANCTVDGAEKAGTIGGLLGETVFVDSDDALKKAMLVEKPLTIVLTKSLDWHPYGQQEIRSDKTLVGNYGVTLKDAQLRTCPNDTDSTVPPSDNLVFRNLTFTAHESTNCMLFNIYSSRNIWIDHCTFISKLPRTVDEVGKFIWCNSPFGGTWKSRATDFITLSYCKFYNRYWTTLFASVSYEVPNNEQIRCRLTLLYCFYDQCVRRCPQMGSSYGHIVSGFWRGTEGQNDSGTDEIIGGGQTDVVSQNCRFEGIDSGHEICAGGGPEPYRDENSYTAKNANATPEKLNFSPKVTSTRKPEQENYGYSLIDPIGTYNVKDFCLQYSCAASAANELKYITDPDMQKWVQKAYSDPFLTTDFESAYGAMSAALEETYSYEFINKNSGLYLGIAADGNMIQTAQSFVWKLAADDEGYYTLSTEKDGTTVYLNVDGDAGNNGANISAQPASGKDGQKIRFLPAGADAYILTTKPSNGGSAVGVTGGSTDEGAKLMQWVCDGSDNQIWEAQRIIASGKLIRNLRVSDQTYAAWSLDSDLQVGDLVYGDRDVTFTAVPAQLLGGEAILTACDAKNSSGDALASFTAGADMTVYTAVDSRVSNTPAFLSGWEKTDLTATGSNSVTFILYRKTVSSGETVTLGANGQSSGCVNYAVFAVSDTDAVRGDLNGDGVCDAADVRLLQAWLLASPTAKPVNWQAGDCNGNGRLDAADLTLMKRTLLAA